MSKTIQIAIGWLLLPLVAWLGMWVYSSAIAPVEMLMLQSGLHAQVWLLMLLVALGHAALFAWPLVKIYGRAASVVAFVMIWPVLWPHIPTVFATDVSATSQLFWWSALSFYVVALVAVVRLVMRSQPRLQRHRAQVTVETLIRRHTRQVLQRQKLPQAVAEPQVSGSHSVD